MQGTGAFCRKALIHFLIAKPYLHYSLLSLSDQNNPLQLFIFTNPGPRVTPEQSTGRGSPTVAKPAMVDRQSVDASHTRECTTASSGDHGTRATTSGNWARSHTPVHVQTDGGGSSLGHELVPVQ